MAEFGTVCSEPDRRLSASLSRSTGPPVPNIAAADAMRPSEEDVARLRRGRDGDVWEEVVVRVADQAEGVDLTHREARELDIIALEFDRLQFDAQQIAIPAGAQGLLSARRRARFWISVRSGTSMTGTRGGLRDLAARRRPWPAMMSLFSSTKIGLAKVVVLMLAATFAICFFGCVRACADRVSAHRG